jgi:hypothetical protein
MFYSLLGRVVWFGLKLFLRRRYGRMYVPKPLLVGAAVALAALVSLLFQRSRSG